MGKLSVLFFLHSLDHSSKIFYKVVVSVFGILEKAPEIFNEIIEYNVCLAGIVYICQTACGSRCKVFVDKVLFQMRPIGIEEGVIFLQMINLNILKWVWHSPVITCASSHCPPLHTLTWGLWMEDIFFLLFAQVFCLVELPKDSIENKMK